MITAPGQGLPEITVTRDQWEVVVDTVRATYDIQNYPAHKCFERYSICPMGAISVLSMELFELYVACGGTKRLSKPADYYELPSLYVAGCKVIYAATNRNKVDD